MILKSRCLSTSLCLVIWILILIRVLTNRNKKPLNFREFNYAKSPNEYGFFNKIFEMLYDLVPSFKLRKNESIPNLIIPVSGL